MFVLGIDPGLSRCGYGVVERAGRRPRAVAAGVLRTDPGDDVPHRLAALRADIRALVSEHRPAVVAIERVLFQVNVRTAIPVAQAAGIAMVEGIAAGAEVVEYSPNQVKQAIAGHGSADKAQMERMVQTLLGIATPLRPVDAADAVALALCHLAFAPMRARVAASSRPGNRAAMATRSASGPRRTISGAPRSASGSAGSSSTPGAVAGRTEVTS